ncbi:hypothetical protein NKH80_12690 [Mesorhizobium sp. M0904]|uniref:hypothetical protein n=1 Tax=unclassified Mesorhizobium TaxID=325217 RepID=UPI00333C54F0
MAKTAKNFFDGLTEEQREKFALSFAEHLKAGSAGKVLVLCGMLDKKLLDLLAANMSGLNKTNKDALFKGTGGLATFSSRIHLAHALGLVEPSAAAQLHRLRKIRNCFAHSDVVIDFDHADVDKLMKSLDRKGVPSKAKSMGTINAIGKMLLGAIEGAMPAKPAAKSKAQ